MPASTFNGYLHPANRMSDRPRRNIPRFDNRAYHLTGNKVPPQQSPDRINSAQPPERSEPCESISTLFNAIESNQPNQLIESNQPNTKMAAESDIELIIEHVNDIIDETPVESCATKDVDIVVEELKNFRHVLRQHRKHLIKEEENQNDKLIATLNITLDVTIKAKEWNFKLEQNRIKRANQDDTAKITAMKFTVADLARKIEEITKKLTVDIGEKTDDQLIQ